MGSVLLVLVGIVALVSAASNCCSPSQLTYESWTSGQPPNSANTLIGAFGTTYYDSINTQLRIDYLMNVTLLGTNNSLELNYSLFFEYAQKVMFYYNHISGSCQALTLPTPFMKVCTNSIPDIGYIANVQVGDSTAQVWGNSTFQIVLSSACNPIFAHTSDSSLGPGLNMFYYNVSPKVSSGAFTLPASCKPHNAVRAVLSAEETDALSFASERARLLF